MSIASLRLGVRGYLDYLRARTVSKRFAAGEVPDREFNLTPIVQTYLASALPLGVITRQRALAGPALNYHLQLFFPAAKLTEFKQDIQVQFLPRIGMRQYVSLGYLRLQEWEPVSALLTAADDLFQRIAAALAEGSYVHAYVNDFFIPRSGAFLRRHFRHDVLIVGCSGRDQEVSCVHYERDGLLTVTRVPFRLFLASLDLSRYGVAKRDFDVALETITEVFNWSRATCGELVTDQLKAYLMGLNNSEKYQPGGPYTIPDGKTQRIADGNGAYGIAVYGHYGLHLDQYRDGLVDLDLRATRILAEHKSLVIRAVEQAFPHSAAKELLRDYTEVATLAVQVHRMAFALTREKDAAGIASVREKFSRLHDREQQALSRLLQRL